MKPKSIENISYNGREYEKRKIIKKSIEVIGLDTEAYVNGQCFLICTSLGDSFQPLDFPHCFFSRKYRGRKFVAYNLKYDSGALVQALDKKHLKELQQYGTTIFQGYKYKTFGNKCFIVSQGKHAITIYDMYNFYRHSLQYNAEKYLEASKEKIATLDFTKEYVKVNIETIKKYCIQDSVLVQRLAALIIAKFEDFGIYPRKLFSVAYVSFQYFWLKTKYPVIRKLWDNDKHVLDMALRSYQGGKFEVTKKTAGHLYEYDIISAYPAEIANLLDIKNARVVKDKKYRKTADYGYIDCSLKIPMSVSSPVVKMRGNVNTYPVGLIERVITKTEYDYMLTQGCDIDIKNAVWLHFDKKQYPFKKEIDRLVALKQIYKKENRELDLHTIKIFLNSLYGKFIQLIPKGKQWIAGASFNPIYATEITSRVRTNISNMQNTHKSIIAVHTDSIISKEKLPFNDSGNIGTMVFETDGDGCIIGSGVYQIGKKSAIRGYRIQASLMDIIRSDKRRISIAIKHANTWREVAFRGWDNETINLFHNEIRQLDVQFDCKRLWVDDYTKFSQVFERPCYSLPLISNEVWN